MPEPAWLVHTATGDPAVDDQVAREADAARTWCVRADDASRSAAWTPAVARGASNKAIARDLGLSPKTVGHHVTHVYAKAGVSTRAAATLFAMEHELLGTGGSPTRS